MKPNFRLARPARLLAVLFFTAGLPAGDYLLRLVTVDATGNFGQCSVTVNYGG